MADAVVLLHVLEGVTGEIIQEASNLRLIQKIGVGVNTIDLETANENGVAVCNMPGTNSRAVAEMTLALMFGAMRRVPYFGQRRQKQARPQFVEHRECAARRQGRVQIFRRHEEKDRQLEF